MSTQMKDDWKRKIDNINSLIIQNGDSFDLIIYTQDCHPKNHVSFISSPPICKDDYEPKIVQYIESLDAFPEHCVEGSIGADFPPQLYIVLPSFLHWYLFLNICSLIYFLNNHSPILIIDCFII